MSDNEELPPLGHSFPQQTIFVGGTIRIIDRDSQWIAEYRAGLVERYFVLGKVGGGLLGIPLKTHRSV